MLLKQTPTTDLNLFDAHCHYNEGLAKIKNATISGYNYKTNLEAKKAAEKFNKYYSLGFAPQELQRKELYLNLEQEIEKIKKQIEQNISEAKFVAIGEVGLDKHWAKTEEESQRQKIGFEKFIKISQEYNLPLVIHSRDAEEECIEILKNFKIKKALLHCFGGNLKQAQQAVEAGFYISIPPIKSKERKKIIQKIPIEFLMIESDAPYLAKSSIQTINSAKMISEYKAIEIEKVIEQTAANAEKFFAKNF
ncbi:MAG: TatD family hydrolase [Candidatus Micrarchaeota archaeon]|nr:TatD family hydrolase [Candidatus Micrarchaeota archaeon]